jgi:hypothetical protein
MALNMWVDDNNGWLPPGAGSSFGLWHGQSTSYNRNSTSEMIYYLARYLSLPAPDATLRPAKVMVCPGFERNAPNLTTLDVGTRKVYVRTVPASAGLTNQSGQVLFDPFGYPPFNTAPPIPPRKLSAIQSVRSLTDVWIMMDADQVAFSTAGWRDELPVKAVHGSVRNYIYFDQHVSTKKVGKVNER